jgi:hypothetical protein
MKRKTQRWKSNSNFILRFSLCGDSIRPGCKKEDAQEQQRLKTLQDLRTQKNTATTACLFVAPAPLLLPHTAQDNVGK